MAICPVDDACSNPDENAFADMDAPGQMHARGKRAEIPDACIVRYRTADVDMDVVPQGYVHREHAPGRDRATHAHRYGRAEWNRRINKCQCMHAGCSAPGYYCRTRARIADGGNEVQTGKVFLAKRAYVDACYDVTLAVALVNKEQQLVGDISTSHRQVGKLATVPAGAKDG
jgi:hypothetical protein